MLRGPSPKKITAIKEIGPSYLALYDHIIIVPNYAFQH
jgi:hypothetical protein